MDDHPLFPLDLEREIFETTAILHPATRTTLLRVARRVHTWIEPFLYRVVVAEDADNPETQRADLVPILLNRPAELSRLAVRHLAILVEPGTPSAEDALRLLKCCDGVTDLALGGSFRADSGLLPLLSELHLRRLAVRVQELGGPDLTHPLFASLTHLILFDDDESHLRSLAPQIPTLSALTHLTAFFSLGQDEILPVLGDCSHLQLFLVLYGTDSMYATAKLFSHHDPRFVIGMYYDYWGQWEAGARGFSDLWSRGDDFLAQKRRGEIEDGRFWLH
ncbi:hypothetical protein C8R46DRAFT_1140603 [Mycena filopes]|nr:hypothetical protein C8R46DRAFT_1140603 [Mycena filopes]